MPLTISEPPAEAFNLVNDRIKQVSRRSQFHTRALRQAQPRSLNLAAPHPIYTLTLEDVLQQRPLEAATATGWRYLVQEGNRAIASAEVLLNSGGGVQAFSQFNEGPYVRATTDMIGVAEELPQVESGAYELRSLRIPALMVMALWLKDADSDRDLILPMSPAPEGLEADRVYGEAEFLAALETLAARQQFDNSPQ